MLLCLDADLVLDHLVVLGVALLAVTAPAGTTPFTVVSERASPGMHRRETLSEVPPPPLHL